MQQPARIIIGLVVLLLFAVGSVVAMQAPAQTGRQAAPASNHEDGEPLGQEALDRFVDRLERAGLPADAGMFDALATEHGVGNAVRLIAWADATGLTVEEIAAMRADGAGWGDLARELDPDGSLALHPGIGWIMRGGSGGEVVGGGPPRHPLGGPPGQQTDD